MAFIMVEISTVEISYNQYNSLKLTIYQYNVHIITLSNSLFFWYKMHIIVVSFEIKCINKIKIYFTKASFEK